MEIKFPGSLTSSLPRNVASPQGQGPITSMPVITRAQKISCGDQQAREREDQRESAETNGENDFCDLEQLAPQLPPWPQNTTFFRWESQWNWVHRPLARVSNPGSSAHTVTDPR